MRILVLFLVIFIQASILEAQSLFEEKVNISLFINGDSVPFSDIAVFQLDFEDYYVNYPIENGAFTLSITYDSLSPVFEENGFPHSFNTSIACIINKEDTFHIVTVQGESFADVFEMAGSYLCNLRLFYYDDFPKLDENWGKDFINHDGYKAVQIWDPGCYNMMVIGMPE